MSEKNFVSGMFFREPSPRAPEWVKGQISIRVSEFTEWYKKNSQGEEWLNLDVKESKGKKLYIELSTYKKGQARAKPEPEPDTDMFEKKEILESDIPF